MRTIPFGRPIIGAEEKAAVQDVLDNPILVHGPRSKQFEQDFAAWVNAPYAVSVSSCTAAMHLVYFALGFGPGDEVIVPAQTHTATAHAVELTGARAVFVDAELETGNLDIGQLEAAITERTRAIAVVHYLGLPVRMNEVMMVARRHGLFVLEDCALAIGTHLDGVHAGLLGDVGCFSFYPVKHMTTAEGGMIILRDPKLAARFAHLRAFGVDRHMGERTMPGIYDVTELGFNYRMNEIEAALGIEQVKRLNEILSRRAANFATLSAALAAVPGVSQFAGPPSTGTHSHYCLSVLLDEKLALDRPQIVARLNAQGVGTSVYYPQAVPLMSYYRKKYGFSPGDFPNAEQISARTIALPVGPHLDETDMDYIADAMKTALREFY